MTTSKEMFYWPASVARSAKYFTYPLMVGVLFWWANGFSVAQTEKVLRIPLFGLHLCRASFFHQELSSENRYTLNKMHQNNQQLMTGLFRNVERQSGYFKNPEKTT
jgi:hypothetical protein